MSRLKALFVIIGIVAVLMGGCKERGPEMISPVYTGFTMGTTYSIKLASIPKREIDPDRIKTGIDRVLKEVNNQMSTYIDSSEISRFNRAGAGEWFAVSSETAMVAAKAVEVSDKSGGAFDVTVGPLVELWGFGRKKHDIVPEDDDILEMKKIIGYRNLEFRSAPPALKKNIAALYCDLSAIAKGHGVDRVADYLDSQSVANYMVEIGGEIRAKGKNSKGQWWKIGIASPSPGGGLQKVIQLRDTGMATSGDYRNYFEKDGIRYSHMIDPRTGRPITHTLASVTILHPSCMEADAFATAISVLGPDKGYQLALQENLPAFFIFRDVAGFVEKMTPQFEALLHKPE